jgi:tetratricopeptide (TPR) repeat protein
VSLLTSAIRAELGAHYETAVGYYRKLARQGSLLDRVGTFQTLARCYEKLAAFKKAGYWHERAGQAYKKLPTNFMGAQEKAYYALIEFRGAVQDYSSGESMRRAAHAYLKALNTCLTAGKEGYSHEMLFAGHLSIKMGQLRKAAGFFKDSAKQFEQERKPKLAREMHRLAAVCLEKAGAR